MKVHANAALGPAGRLALCSLVDEGKSLRAAAAALNVSPATAHRWWHRRQAASAEQVASGAWLGDRSSRPRRQPRRLSAAQEEPILRARRETGLGPGRLAGIVRRARSTIWKVLHRHGLSRLRRSARESYRRYEWSRPGALLHVDTTRLARFQRPGHRFATLQRKPQGTARAGLSLSARLRRRSLSLRLRRAAQRRASRHRRPLHAPSDPALQNTRPGAAGRGDERQRQPLSLLRLPSRARARRRPPDPHPALHTPLERQGLCFSVGVPSGWAARLLAPAGLTQAKGVSGCWAGPGRDRPSGGP